MEVSLEVNPVAFGHRFEEQVGVSFAGTKGRHVINRVRDGCEYYKSGEGLEFGREYRQIKKGKKVLLLHSSELIIC